MMDYQKHMLDLACNKTFSVGDEVFVLIDYSLVSGFILKVNDKSIKIKLNASFGVNSYEKNCKPEKVVRKGDYAVLVWECWKGVNGRGGYRLDTIMYPDLQKPVDKIRPNTYLNESEFGEVSDFSKKRYLEV